MTDENKTERENGESKTSKLRLNKETLRDLNVDPTKADKARGGGARRGVSAEGDSDCC